MNSHLTQKVRPGLVWFAFACFAITTGLLYTMQKAEATADALASDSEYYFEHLD